MSRMLSVLIAIIVLLLVFLAARYVKESYSQPLITNPPQESVSTEGTPQATQSTNPPIGLQDWREFSSESGRFKVLLPALPQHAAEKILDSETKESRKYDTFVSTSSQGNVFMISKMTFPQKLDKAQMEDTLKTIVSEILKRNKENKLKAMKFQKFHEQPALDFSLTNGDLLIVGKVLANNDTAYVLSMMGKEDTFDHEELDAFVNSFQVIEGSKKPQKRSDR